MICDSYICFHLPPALQKNDGHSLPVATRVPDETPWMFIIFVVLGCVSGLLTVAVLIALLRSPDGQLASGKLGLGPEAGNVTHYEYQVGRSV